MNNDNFSISRRPAAGTITINEFGQVLEEALLLALERRYIHHFDQLSLLDVKTDDSLSDDIRMLRIKEIAHSADLSRSLHYINMQNILGSFRDGEHALVFCAMGEEDNTRLYLGIKKMDPNSPTLTTKSLKILQNGLYGNYPGISVEPLREKEIVSELMTPIEKFGYLGSLTGIPSLKLKDQSRELFVQGLERITNSLKGCHYGLLVIAEPIQEQMVDSIIQKCRALISEIHTLVSVGLQKTIGEGTTKSQLIESGTAVQLGVMVAELLKFVPLMPVVLPVAMPMIGNLLGLQFSTNSNTSNSESIQMINKTAEYCEQLLGHYIQRLQQGMNQGFWNCGIYLMADDPQILHQAQAVVRGVLSGDETYFEPMRIIEIEEKDKAALKNALTQFEIPGISFPNQVTHPLGAAFGKLSTPIHTGELSLVINFPHQEVPGIGNRQMAGFGLNPPLSEGFVLGKIIHGRNILNNVRYSIRPDDLTRHTFVSGITGSGKTNTCLALLKAVHQKRRPDGTPTPFLVIDPAKKEYRSLLADDVLGKDLQVFTLGDEMTSPFRLNPFEFVKNYPLLTHIDLLKAVFNASFPMYASMPYILEEAIMDVYINRGWDLSTSSNHYMKDAAEDYSLYLPTLQDLYDQIDVVVERKQYAQELTMDISAALKARIKSLLVGGKGLMLNCPKSYPLATLFEKNTILELKSVGDDGEKAFLMALLFINLYEYCEINREPLTGLQHLTLIEEAHRLLKNIPPSISAESANPRGKAVEMFTDILSEIRSYGEGFIVVDQVPSKLTPDVIKNTNLKILHRLVASDDRQSVGETMGLTLEQKEYLLHLKIGQAVIHDESLDVPILLQVNHVKDDLQMEFNKLSDSRKVHEKMAAYRLGVRDIFLRFPACSGCKAPCTFFTDINVPSEADTQSFNEWLNLVLVADLETINNQWKLTMARLKNSMNVTHHGSAINDGEIYCHFAQLAHQALKTRLEFYQGGRGGHRSLIKLEYCLADLFTNLLSKQSTENLEAIIQRFRLEYYGEVALEPRNLEPACQLCKKRCFYGYLVQSNLTEYANLLSEKLKIASEKPGFTNNVQALEDTLTLFTRDMLPGVGEEHLHDLAYCFFSNSGVDRMDILRKLQI